MAQFQPDFWVAAATAAPVLLLATVALIRAPSPDVTALMDALYKKGGSVRSAATTPSRHVGWRPLLITWVAGMLWVIATYAVVFDALALVWALKSLADQSDAVPGSVEWIGLAVSVGYMALRALQLQDNRSGQDKAQPAATDTHRTAADSEL